MADRDRHGERVEEPCRDPRCRRGWLGHDLEQRPVPCPACKPHLAVTVHDNDFAESTPSVRAQQAIDAANERENR